MALLRAFSLMTLLLSAIAVAGCGGGGGGSSDDSPGDRSSLNACEAIGLNIINGEICQLGTNPGGTPIVRLVIVDTFNQVGICTGTAIDATTVLTAAHCFLNGVAALDVDTVFGTVGASDVLVHPGFQPNDAVSAIFNDVALVRTAAPLPVSTYPLLTTGGVSVGEEAIVAGYGTNSSGDVGGLEAGTARVGNVTQNHIFTAFDGQGSNPCTGDSGGPLLLFRGGALVVSGVVSTGRRGFDDCQAGDVTLYANLSDPSIRGFLEGSIAGVPPSTVDSLNCIATPTTCTDGQPVCSERFCDGVADCSDGSDESAFLCQEQSACCQSTGGCPGETPTACAPDCCCCGLGLTCDQDSFANGCVARSGSERGPAAPHEELQKALGLGTYF